MASRFFGVNRGQDKTKVTQGASTTSKNCEFSVDLAVIKTKKEALDCLEVLEAAIEQNKWPPA